MGFLDFFKPRRKEARAPGVLLYNGRPYAVGLLWFTVQEDSLKALLGQRLKKTRADFYCNRIHISQQQGFGWLDMGHRRGMAVAAAMVADQLVGEWHGVFEADNGWWYVAVRSDTITPQGDKFFTTEEDAFNLFKDEMAKHTWPHAYAPQKWHIADGQTREVSLKNLLDEFATTKLVNANLTALFGGTAQRNIVLAALGVIVVLMLCLVLYSASKSDDVVTIKPGPHFTPRQVNTAKPVLTAGTGGSEFISPQQMLQQCGHAADQLMLAIPGWEIQGFTCGNSRAAMTWKQVSGTLSQARQAAKNIWPPETAVTFTNHIMTAVLTLPPLPKLQPEALPGQDEALLILEQTLQPLGALQIKPVIPPAPKVAPVSRFSTEVPPPPPPAAPPYLDIQYLSGFAPDRIVAMLQAPGLEVTEVQWSIDRALWQYKIKWTHARGAAPPPPTKLPAPASAGSAANAVAAKPGAPAAPVPNAATAPPQLKPVTPAPPPGGQK